MKRRCRETGACLDREKLGLNKIAARWPAEAVV